MKPSEKLYNINSYISAKCVALDTALDIKELHVLNGKLAEIIKQVRHLEDRIELLTNDDTDIGYDERSRRC